MAVLHTGTESGTNKSDSAVTETEVRIGRGHYRVIRTAPTANRNSKTRPKSARQCYLLDLFVVIARVNEPYNGLNW